MRPPTDNETWIIEAGDAVISKKASGGIECLSPLERLIYCLWVADYGMRNAGDLGTASDIYPEFQTEAVELASQLGLPTTKRTFAMSKSELEHAYLVRFDEICNEIRTHA